MSGQIGIGIIGAGTIAERMLAAWQPHMQHARLVAVADVNPERVQLFRHKFGIPSGYTDYQEMLGSTGVDAVLVLTPNYLHAPQTIAAANAGKHVLCQKPFALNLAEAEAMVAAARANNVILMAAFVKRFWPYYVKVRQLIDEGILGNVVAVRTQYSHSGIGKYYVPASDWFYDPGKSGGGPLIDLGVHHFDVLRWMIGADATEVAAEVATLGHDIRVEDNAAVTLRFSNGVIAQGYYSFTTIAPPGVTLERLEVYGTKGTAIVTLSQPGRVTVQVCTEADPAAPLGGGWVDLPVTEPVPAFALMLQHFVDCIRSGLQPVTTGIDGWHSIAMIEAAYRSAREGKRVAVARLQR